MPAALSIHPGRVRILPSGYAQLTRGRLSPVGRDLQQRGIRVTRRMKTLATGAEGGPNVRTGNLLSNIRFIDFGEDAQGLRVRVGVDSPRMVRRNWNYAYVLEGPSSVSDPRITLRTGHDFGEGVRRPFLAKSLQAAAN